MKNGIIKKISALTLGVAMALGVGVAVSSLSRGAVKEARAADKITDYKNITAGNYYIGATNSSVDYYLSVDGSSLTTSIAGTAVTSKASGTIFTFAGSGTSWTIKFADNDYYLSLKSSKDNGKVQVVSSAATFTASNESSKIRLSKGSYSIQKNNAGTQFGSYGNTQTDIWLLPAESDEPSVSFTNPTTGVEVGKTVTNVATGNNLGDATIVYTSSNGGVATVNSSGVVTGVAEGNATITAKATVKGTDYSASYAIRVYKVYSYQLIKAANDLVAGEEYVIGATWNDVDYFFSTNQKTNNREAIPLTVSNDIVSSADRLEVFVLGGESDAWTFSPKSADDLDTVIYAPSTSSNQLKTASKTTADDKGQFTVTVSNTGVATATANNNLVRGKVGFNYDSSTNWFFSCYDTVPNTATTNLGIYRLVEVEAYAKTFQDAIDTICVVETGNSDVDDLNAAWITLAAAYNALSSNDKATLVGTSRSLSGNAVQKAIYMYDYICVKYNTKLQSETVANYNFMGRTIQPFGQSNVVVKGSMVNANNTIVVITIIASVSVLALGALLLLKKKKEN